MRKNALRAIFVFVILFTLSASVAQADTIEITSGAYVIRDPAPPDHRVDLVGQNFGLSGGGTGNANFPGCEFCQPGRTLDNTNLTIVGLDHASVSYNGAGYTQGFNYGMGIVLSFAGGGFTFPVPPAGATSFSITVPFTFTGSVSVSNIQPGGGLLFSHTLFGDGMVTLDYFIIPALEPGRLPIFQLNQATYDFAPSAIPEPATLLLLGSGLVGAGFVTRRKRRRASSD